MAFLLLILMSVFSSKTWTRRVESLKCQRNIFPTCCWKRGSTVSERWLLVLKSIFQVCDCRSLYRLSVPVISSVKRWIYVTGLTGLSVKMWDLSGENLDMGNLGFKNWLRLDYLPHGTRAKIGSSLINMCWWNLYIVYHSNYSLFYCCMWISRFKIILIQINLFQ